VRRAISAVSPLVVELSEGRRRGYDVPDPADLAWLHLVDPQGIPSEWLAPEVHRRTG